MYINSSLRNGLIKEWNEKNPLGIRDLENKDLFLLAVALGLSNPVDLPKGKDGFIRIQYVKTFDKALIASIMLGKPENDGDIDKYANDDINYDEAERCAESGFKVLNQLIEDAGGDAELLEKRAFKKLELLYQQYVATDL